METSPLVLRPLSLDDEPSFREAVAEFKAEQPPWDFSLGWAETEDFSEYLQKLDNIARGVNLPAGLVPASFYVGVVGGAVVGRVSLRHELNEFLARIGGHVGYGVRPSQRRRGYATAMLRQALPLCAARGITHALITCDVDNEGSRRVIERCGGVFEGLTADPTQTVQKRRYWVKTTGAVRG